MSLWRVKLAYLAVAVLFLELMPDEQGFAVAMRRAEAFRAAMEYGSALQAYVQAAGLNTASPQPWQQLGSMLLVQHRFDQAATAFHEAERRGGGVDALLGRGESLAGRGDWAAAIQAWLRAQALAPRDARIPLALGRAAIAQGRLETAEAYLVEALRLKPDPEAASSAHSLLGRLLAGKDRDRAAEHLRRAGDTEMLGVLQAAGAEPDPAREALLLGVAFLQRGELTLARHQLEQARSRAPDNAEAYAYLGHVLDRMGETVAARAALESALRLDRDLVLGYYFLGVHHRQVGNPPEAQAAFWEGLNRDPENAALRAAMAEACLDLYDYAGAEEWYRGAVEVAPSDQQLAFRLMLAHFYLDHLYHIQQGGVPAAEAAAALAPDDAQVQDLLGWAYHLAGRHGEAERVLRAVLAQAPDLASVYYHLGSLYSSTGRVELARTHLQRAADLDTTGYYRSRAEALLGELR